MFLSSFWIVFGSGFLIEVSIPNRSRQSQAGRLAFVSSFDAGVSARAFSFVRGGDRAELTKKVLISLDILQSFKLQWRECSLNSWHQVQLPNLSNRFKFHTLTLFYKSGCSPGCSLTLVSFPSFSLFPTPVDRVSPNRCLKARHEADSFEPAEWSERLPSRRSGWLGAAAAGSIPAFSTFFSLLFLFFQRQHSSSAREITSLLALFSCLSLFSSAGSSWLLSHARFFPFFLPLKARHEADSFEPAEWSERLPSRRSGWLGAAAAGSIPAFSTFFSLLFLFFQRQLFYKIRNGLAPTYLSEILPETLALSSGRNLRRHVYPFPRINKSSTMQSFLPRATVFWNELPASIQSSSSLHSFKAKLRDLLKI